MLEAQRADGTWEPGPRRGPGLVEDGARLLEGPGVMPAPSQLPSSLVRQEGPQLAPGVSAPVSRLGSRVTMCLAFFTGFCLARITDPQSDREIRIGPRTFLSIFWALRVLAGKPQRL